MSLITRCPTCETMFRVVPDQLRVSEGWVRCGQCGEVFDATQNMVPSPDTVEPAPQAPVSEPHRPAAATTAAPAAIPAAPPAPNPTPTFIRPAADSEAPEPVAPLARTGPTAKASDPEPLAVEIELPDSNEARATDPETVFLESDIDADSPTHPLVPPSESPLRWQAAEPVMEPERYLEEPAAGAALPPSARTRARATTRDDVAPPSFMGDEGRPSFWRRPAMRWVLLAVLLGLLALLVGQIVWKERDRIAATAPASRQALQALCGMVGCKLSPLRQIESVVIDSSSFSRVRGDDYRLGFALRNTAPIAIAMPSIELSLTDPQDQAVIRRVIQPAEFASGAPTLAKDSLWSGSLALSVRPGNNTDRIAGYRLLAFYP